MLVRLVVIIAAFLVVFCAIFVRPETSLDYIPIRYTMYKYELYDVFRRAAGKRFEKKWNREHPDRKIRTFYEPGASPYPPKVNAEVVAGTARDIFFVPDYFKYAKQGSLLNIQPYIEKNGDEDYFGEIYPILLEPHYIDGKLYAVPGNLNTEVLYYNKALFRDAGVPYPDETWTWETMLEAAKKLARRDEEGRLVQYGLTLSAPARTVVWNGGRFWSDDLNRCTINGPAAVEALQFQYDLIFKHRVSPEPKEVMTLSSADAFKRNRCAMFVGGRWWTAEFWKLSDVEFSVAPLPRSLRGLRRGYASYNVLGIYSQTKYPDICYEFLKFLCSPEQIHNLVVVGDSIPIRPAPKYNRYFLNEPRSDPGSNQAYLDVMADSVSMFSPYFRHPEVPQEEQNLAWTRVIDRVWLHEKTPKEALDECAARLQRTLERVRTPPQSVEPLPYAIGFGVLAVGGIGLGVFIRRRYRSAGEA